MNPSEASNALRRAALGLLALATVLSAFACGEESPPPEPVARPVKLLEIGAGGLAVKLEFPGEVKAGQRAEIGFEVAGKIEEFVVKEGEIGEEGEGSPECKACAQAMKDWVPAPQRPNTT